VERLYVGPLMTALDMNGFSLTLMEVDDARLEMLDAPTEVGLGSGLGAVIP
jgi:dihydroxyacetone kinase